MPNETLKEWGQNGEGGKDFNPYEKPMNEDIAEMMMCPLCGFIEEDKLHRLDTYNHKEKGMHRTGNKTWSPMKGHPDYDKHLKWSQILNLKTN